MLIIRPILALLISTLSATGQVQPLYIIVDHNKTGFINSEGTTVIPPIYHIAYDFSEGLAAVRQEGQYGFIDSSGKYRIAPEYDFATPFVKGIALVYKKENPLFIDKTNKVVFPPVYQALQYIDDKKAIITTVSKKQGVIDVRTGRLLIDTVFSDISEFTNGVAVVKELERPGRESFNDRVAVIDSTGKFIAPFGKYASIRPFSEDHAIVELNTKSLIYGVIDSNGQLLFKKKYKDGYYLNEDVHEGLVSTSLNTPSSTDDYAGYINLHGDVVINDTNYISALDFSCGRAFAQTKDFNYVVIDRNGKRISTEAYLIQNRQFINNYAIVSPHLYWGVIDTNAHYIVKPQYGMINFPTPFDGHYFFSNPEQEKPLYGMADLDNHVIIQPCMQDYAAEGFVNGLLKSIVNNRLTYFNKKGEIVWQEQKQDSLPLKQLNIDYMNRSYFYAYSTPKNKNEEEHGGGWAISENKPKMISSSNQFTNHELSIKIDPSVVDTFAKQYYGYKVYLSNRTNDTIRFKAEDSRLYMKLQAFDEIGNWKDIEYNPHSWCGNSYHTIELEPDAYWSFTIPRYTGSFRTSIRVALKYIDKQDPKKELTIYSDLINASINPGQFWNKRPYYPNGIMDPYYE